MPFIFFLILFYPTTLALNYNDTCTKNCNFPGMICVNHRCVCDSRNRLFWTNARCALCPNDWTMTETACIIYYETAMPWERAKLTCQNLEAELISFRNKDLISSIYSATTKKQFSGSSGKLSAWTGAHVTGSGVFQWLDKNVTPIDKKSTWWCKKNTSHLGYAYKDDEPTRYTDNNNQTEACVVYWRGTTDTQVVCLDDQLCNQEFPFVCEKSESTANQYLGLPPKVNSFSNVSSNDLRDIIHNVDGRVETIIINTANGTPKSNVNIIITLLVMGLLLLLALLGGLFFFLKRRNAIKTQFNINRSSGAASPTSRRSIASANDTTTKDDFTDPPTNTSESGFALASDTVPENTSVDIDGQKSRRGGYSKQQFDEFE